MLQSNVAVCLYLLFCLQVLFVYILWHFLFKEEKKGGGFYGVDFPHEVNIY